MSIVYDLINSTLLFLYGLTGNLGITIILFTVVVKVVLLPLTIPSIKTQKLMKKLQPELKTLKTKHGSDKKAFQQAQLELYKKYNMNPIAGCLPQLVQIGMIIVLYQALTVFLRQTEVNGQIINTFFLWLDLGKTDPKYVIPLLAGGTQLVLSLMIAPATEVADVVPNDSKLKKVQEANKKEEGVADMAATMQQQMLFMMPLMTAFISARFPSGLGLYWIVTTILAIVQQYFISGPGGLMSYSRRAYNFVMKYTGGQQLKPTPALVATPSTELAQALSKKTIKPKTSKKQKPIKRKK